jgi:hypothetical protein
MKDQTPKVLRGMIVEYTGASICDSGYYGRHWEKNQKKYHQMPKIFGIIPNHLKQLPLFRNHILKYNFEKNKTAYIDFSSGYIDITIDIYHYLKKYLEYDREKTTEFLEFAEEPELANESWLDIMRAYIEKYTGNTAEIYNSYNWENFLSQVIQFANFTDRNVEYIILQIHNGADVRGGYTEPKIFKVVEFDDFILSMDNVYISCWEHHWRVTPEYSEYLDTNIYEGGETLKLMMLEKDFVQFVEENSRQK